MATAQIWVKKTNAIFQKSAVYSKKNVFQKSILFLKKKTNTVDSKALPLSLSKSFPCCRKNWLCTCYSENLGCPPGLLWNLVGVGNQRLGLAKDIFFLVHMTWCVSFSIFFDVWKRKCGDKIWVMVKFDFDVCFFTLEYLQAIKECNGVWHWSSILKWHNSTYKKILALGLWDSFCSWLWWQRKTQCGSMAMHN